jgi:tetratricopeptide (TPR) repeat protein
MTPERWQQIRQVFISVIEVPSSERRARVAAECGDDERLEAEVLRLLALSEEGKTFLERPAFRLLPDTVDTEPSVLLADGDIVADRFRIVRLLGRGGMGEVYEAEDAVLGDRVALKVMRGVGNGAAGDGSEIAARLRREVLLARRITHPGVCRVHDVASERMPDGTARIVLTMELLAGETLAERLRQGPLPPDEALDLARQLAAALDAAHAEKVLHRDIKPGNILLVRRPDGSTRAVLTDFGLARGLEQGSTAAVTRAGAIIGTPEYMAPEQLRGEPPTVRSDVYVFGLVLFEILTGQQPYANALWKRTIEPLPAVETILPGLGHGWTEALSRTLQPDPALRFGSAGDIVRAIEQAQGGPSPSIRPRRRGPLTLAACAVALLALIAIAVRLYLPRPLPPASLVLLTDTVNATGDDDFDGATEVLRSQLVQSPHFETIAPTRVAEVLGQMQRDPAGRLEPEVAREVAMREGAPLVVYSALTRLGPEYVLRVRLERVAGRPSLFRTTQSETFTASSKAAVFDIFREAALWTRTSAGETAADLIEQDRPPADTTTSSWEALQLFAKATARHAAGQLDDAALLFEDALRRDPEFAMAQMRLADVLISLKRDAEGYEAWRKAIRLLDARQVSSRESLRVKGQYLEDTGDLPAAERAFQSYVLHYPNDYHAAFFLGSVLHDLGRTAEAVPWLEKASSLRPGALAAPVHLATAQIELAQSDRAANTAAVLRQHGHDRWARWIDALSLFAQSDVTAALEAIEPLRTGSDPQWRSRATMLRASWLTEAGRLQEAAFTLREGIQHDTAEGLRRQATDKWLHLAEILRRIGDHGGCEDALARAEVPGATPTQLMMAGAIWTRAGRIDEAERLLARFEDHSEIARAQRAKARLTGEIRLARGQAREAAAIVDTAMIAAPQRESRLTLVRTLIRAGDRGRAERLLADLVSRPTVAYSAPEPEWPGLWSEGLLEYATLLDGAKRPEASRYWSLYQHVKKGADR